ncbi:MAG: serine hydrolase, partial [Gemmatimonadota bacterium]
MLRAALLSSLCATSLSAQSPTDSLRDRIAARASSLPGATVAVYYRDLGNGETLAWNADSTFHAASTMKVPVMIEYFRGVDDGRFAEGDRVTLANRFRSIVDGSPYVLDAGDDSDSALYRRVGEPVPVRE